MRAHELVRIVVGAFARALLRTPRELVPPEHGRVLHGFHATARVADDREFGDRARHQRERTGEHGASRLIVSSTAELNLRALRAKALEPAVLRACVRTLRGPRAVHGTMGWLNDLPEPAGVALSVVALFVSIALGLGLGVMQLAQGVLLLVSAPALKGSMMLLARYLYSTRVGYVHVWAFRLVRRCWANGKPHSRSLRVNIPVPPAAAAAAAAAARPTRAARRPRSASGTVRSTRSRRCSTTTRT